MNQVSSTSNLNNNFDEPIKKLKATNNHLETNFRFEEPGSSSFSKNLKLSNLDNLGHQSPGQVLKF